MQTNLSKHVHLAVETFIHFLS